MKKILALVAGLMLSGLVFAQTYFGFNPNTALEVFHGSLVSGGSQPTLSGCATISAAVGGATAGKFATSGTSCTLTVTFSNPAPNGWFCVANDLTTTADKVVQSASTTTSCSFTGTTVAADVITWAALGY